MAHAPSLPSQPINNRHNARRQGLLVNVAGALELPQPDVVVRQLAPQLPCLSHVYVTVVQSVVHTRIDGILPRPPTPYTLTRLVGEAGQARADDGVHLQAPGNGLRVLGAHVAKPHPERVLGRALGGEEGVVVHADGQLRRRLLHLALCGLTAVSWLSPMPAQDIKCQLHPSTDRQTDLRLEVVDVGLPVAPVVLQVPPVAVS